MSANQIERKIDELEDFVESCKFKPLSKDIILVDKTQLIELIADLHQTDGALCLRNIVFPLLGRVVREHFLQLFRCYEENVVRQNLFNIIVADGHVLLCFAENPVDAADYILQRLHVAVLLADDLLPVPLVNID